MLLLFLHFAAGTELSIFGEEPPNKEVEEFCHLESLQMSTPVEEDQIFFSRVASQLIMAYFAILLIFLLQLLKIFCEEKKADKVRKSRMPYVAVLENWKEFPPEERIRILDEHIQCLMEKKRKLKLRFKKEKKFWQEEEKNDESTSDDQDGGRPL